MYEKCIINIITYFFAGLSPGKESPARSTALREVKRLIDQDSFPAKYIIMYEEPSNDIGSIYMITPANSPLVEGSLERPEKVIKYKDRYICLMNPMESTDMPKNKLIEITDYPNDTTTGPVYDEIWYIGVSKNGKKHSLVSATYKSYLTYRYYSFPQLLEYTFEDYDSTHLPRFILASYSLVVDTSYVPKGTFINHIQRIDGEIYYSNVLDEYFKENKDVRRRACTIRYGASCISLANRWKRTPQHVGAWMVFHQESRYNYPVINNCFMVLNELRMEQRNLWNA